MPPIDEKVVSVDFQYGKFKAGVGVTLNLIKQLNDSLKFPNAGKGLDDIGKAAGRVDLGHIGNALDQIKNRLSAFRLTAIAVFAEVAAKAVSAGARFIKSFSLEPLKAGFAEYSTNLNAVQTILANTQASGATLKDVNAALLDLNKYSDQTIYNFSQMAKNIGTFTAAGVELKTATGAIKGIANLAALSGSNAEQASTAMYQLSQAISSGRVSLQDWNSVVNAGMGGTIFQRALAQTAVAMGKLKDGAVQLEGPMKNVRINGQSFRESIGGPGPKWLTSDILTATLQQFTGDLSDAQLKAEGFDDAQIKAIQATAKTALHAATEVKTLSQVLDVAKEAAGSGWAQTWQIVFGDFGEAKKTFTDLSNAINTFINNSANARNKVLADWKALGGRTVLINAIKSAFQSLGQILKPIKDAFRDIFPATTGRDLYNLTLQFKAFADALKPSPETIENLRRTFRGLFAILDIGKQVIQGIFGMFGKLIGVTGAGRGGFLSFTASIGDFLVALDLALKKGNLIEKFFDGLGDILAVPIHLFSLLAEAIGNLFRGFSPGGFSAQMSDITDATLPFKEAIDAIIASLQGFGPAVHNAIANMNFEAILAVIRTGLLGGLVILLKKFIGGTTFADAIAGIGGGVFSNLSGALGTLTGTMKSMQRNIQAKTLKEIAIAIALLAASLVALSFVNPERLNSALGAMTIAFGELIGAMAIIDKITNSRSFIKLPIIAASLIGLAAAIDLLVIAVLAMSRLSWKELTKGLSGVAALLAGLSAASGPLSKNAAGMIRAGISITAIAVAMKILASAVADFGALSWTEIGKGLSAVAIGLTAIAGSAQLMPKGMIAKSLGLIATAEALTILADAVAKFGALKWNVIGRGLAGVGGSLVAIALAMHLMPKSMIITGAGLLIVAASLEKISNAVKSMGGMPIRVLAKGIISLGVALGVLAVALHAMSGTLGGAAALAIAATGISLLAKSLVALGGQSWTSIIKGLVALAASLGVVAGAALLLAPAIPALLGFGVALVALGAGLALAGAGIALIGVGLSAIAASGSASVAILVAAVTQLSEAIPAMAKNFVLGLLEIVKAFAATAPQFVNAMIKILDSVLDAIIKASPKIGKAFEALLIVALQVVNNNIDKVVQAGFNVLLALLNGINNNISKVVASVTNIVVNFLGAISNNLGRIISAGTNVLLKFLQGIANNIAKVILAGGNIIISFVTGITNNIARIVTAGLNIMVKLLTTIASKIGDVIKAGTNVIVNFVTGIGNAAPRIVAAGTTAMIKFINALVKQSLRLVDAGAKAVINFLNGVADAINKYEPQMLAAGARIGAAIVTGMIRGLVSWAPSLYSKASEIAGNVLGKLGKVLHLGSPSKETYKMGGYVMQGLANGMADNRSALISAENMGNAVISMFKDVFQITSPSKVMEQIGKYVGEGFSKGLRGSSEDINSAFHDMNEKLTEAMSTARETIASEQEKLDKLRAAKKPDAEAIKKAQQTIEENEKLLARSTAGHIALTKTLKDEHKELNSLANDYDKVTDKLKKAQDVLADAIKTRDDAISSYTDQYSTLPDIVKTDAEGAAVDQLAAYEEALQHQVAAVGAYKATLDQLRQLGLDDATYQKLLREGTADQEFANQLLAGGRTAVQGLNALDKQLKDVSGSLAVNAAKNLYQAGVDAAEGLVRGLESKRSRIRRTMENIAREILQALKSELKIKSPSQEFANIGKFSMEGLALGFTTSTKLVTDAVDEAAKTALSTLTKSMNNISDVVVDNLDTNPVITPILDLTQVQDQAKELTKLTSAVPITAAASYGQASIISSQQATAAEEALLASARTIKFEQNNYSPEALSEVEIYRQTRNQLSQIRVALEGG